MSANLPMDALVGRGKAMKNAGTSNFLYRIGEI